MIVELLLQGFQQRLMANSPKRSRRKKRDFSVAIFSESVGMKMKLKSQRGKQDGFTLLEIMIVVAIIGILAAVAIPNFLNWLPNYRLKAAVRDLQGHFQTAKLEAIKQRANVSIVFVPGAYAVQGRIGSYGIQDAGGNVMKTVNMPSSISLIAAVPTTVVCTSRGLPSVATTVTLQNSQNVRAQVSIILSGRVNIQRSLSTDNGATWPPYQQWD